VINPSRFGELEGFRRFLSLQAFCAFLTCDSKKHWDLAGVARVALENRPAPPKESHSPKPGAARGDVPAGTAGLDPVLGRLPWYQGSAWNPVIDGLTHAFTYRGMSVSIQRSIRMAGTPILDASVGRAVPARREIV
jgi:hypothetical protein